MKKVLLYAVAALAIAFPCVSVFAVGNFGRHLERRGNSPSLEKESAFYLYGLQIVNTPGDGDEGPTVLGGKGEANKYIRIINLGPLVNHNKLDYAPTVSADGKTVYFVSDRKGSKLNKNDDPSHDFWCVKKENELDTVFSTPFNIDPTIDPKDIGVNTARNEGVASISADRQTLVFTGCNRADGYGKCDLYITQIDGDKWSLPRNLGRKVNSEWWDSQPSINAGKDRIYFSSNRPNPKLGHDDEAQMDLYYTDYDFDNEEWKEAVSLGPEINTDGKEEGPFIAADGRTLFFSSDKLLPSLGKRDFFITKLGDDGKTWSKPANLGAPLNSAEDDQFITVTASSQVLYFSSKRTDYPNYSGDLDVFMAFIPSFFKVPTLLVDVVDECSGEQIASTISVKNPATGKVTTEEVTREKPVYSLPFTTGDFGSGKQAVVKLKVEVTSSNARYGKKTAFIEIPSPTEVHDKGEAAESPEHKLTIRMGQRPVLGTDIATADFIDKESAIKPESKTWKGLVMVEKKTREIFPLLNYVFFDSVSSTLPSRYVKLDASQTANFSDETIPGGVFEKYWNVMNVYGYRMRKQPELKIEIVGCNDSVSPGEKSLPLSQSRADLVFKYFKDVWGIDPSRMKVSVRNLPARRSNPKDTFGIRENRRVEILCDSWDFIKPILDVNSTLFPDPDAMKWTMKNGIEDDLIASRRIEIEQNGQKWATLTDLGIDRPNKEWDWKKPGQSFRLAFPKDNKPFTAKLIVTTKSGQECTSDPINVPVRQVSTNEWVRIYGKAKTLEKYNLILFKFDSDEPGPINDKIFTEYIFPRAYPTSEIDIEGHTDVVGEYSHNQRLSERRAKSAYNGIQKFTAGKYASMKSKGVGEDTPLYDNNLQEGRFYNRTVQVMIQTPLEDAKD